MTTRFHFLVTLLYLLTCSLRAQDATTEGEKGKERVKYQLVLPDEKSPENVKPEEHNPFESESEAMNRNAPGDTEETRVRDKLLSLHVGGVSVLPSGKLRVLLGDIMLTAGETVPHIFPDQAVELKVKAITPDAIELAWQEKRATGLPSKMMLIPIDIGPTIDKIMPGGVRGQPGIRERSRPETFKQRMASSQGTKPLQALPLKDEPINTPSAPTPELAPATTPAPASQPPATIPNPALESAIRMMFGTKSEAK